MTFKEIKPSIWKPLNKDDSIVGTLIRIEDSKKYKNKVYGLENKEGQWIVFGSAVLDDRMKYCKEGDTIKIVYNGSEKNKKAQDTKMFTVLVDK